MKSMRRSSNQDPGNLISPRHHFFVDHICMRCMRQWVAINEIFFTSQWRGSLASRLDGYVTISRAVTRVYILKLRAQKYADCKQRFRRHSLQPTTIPCPNQSGEEFLQYLCQIKPVWDR